MVDIKKQKSGREVNNVEIRRAYVVENKNKGGVKNTHAACARIWIHIFP